MNLVGTLPTLDSEVLVLPAASGLTDLEAEWRVLAQEAENADCFATPAYFRAWLETLSKDVDPFILTIRHAGRLIHPLGPRWVWRRGCANRADG